MRVWNNTEYLLTYRIDELFKTQNKIQCQGCNRPYEHSLPQKPVHVKSLNFSLSHNVVIVMCLKTMKNKNKYKKKKQKQKNQFDIV
jgi:hypothetical protein